MDWWCAMRSSAEVFTAMADVENLIHTEDNVVDVIEQYIESDLRRLQRLKSFSFFQPGNRLSSTSSNVKKTYKCSSIISYRLNIQLSNLAQEYRESKEKALKEGADRLYNPVNAFLFIKKLTEEWNDVELLMKSDHADSK
ncbi:prolyl 4-hydroxylase subunit alpha-1 [Trichinella spiralis]|uniref:prolyl 4-hydroxylase subunit alpha-1 n=1 Tax=Trichinella spiralis TaxID=6334 RepID=UPI0001EFC9AE|nr:prolyl 4-hydroxylase subunit alpha-1 [Trichinella spiralis]